MTALEVGVWLIYILAGSLLLCLIAWSLVGAAAGFVQLEKLVSRLAQRRGRRRDAEAHESAETAREAAETMRVIKRTPGPGLHRGSWPLGSGR